MESKRLIPPPTRGFPQGFAYRPAEHQRGAYSDGEGAGIKGGEGLRRCLKKLVANGASASYGCPSILPRSRGSMIEERSLPESEPG